MNDEDPRAIPRRRRRWPWVLGAALLVVGAWAVAAVSELRAVERDARSGIDRLQAARTQTDDLVALVGTADDEDDTGARVAGELAIAHEDIAAARDRASGRLFAPLNVVPVLGRQLRAVTSLLDEATQVTRSLAVAIGDLEEISDRPAVGPAARLAALDATLAVLERLRAELQLDELGPTDGLLVQVANARNEFTAALVQTQTTLDGAIVSVSGVGAFLRGPTTYLVLAANNAEMRAGSGMYLQVGTLSVLDGRIELSDFLPTSEFVLDEPGAALDPDLEQRWGAFAPSRDWRNLNLSPRFDETARMAADMWSASGRGEVDGVMSMDVGALRQLIDLTGPVEVDHEGAAITLDAERVERLLLVEQYLDFESTDERRELLARVLSAGFQAFDDRQVSVSGLVRLFDSGGAARNLLMWSSSSIQQKAWVELGVSGILPEDPLLLALINRGANKLDPYVHLSADLQSSVEGEYRTISLTTTIANLAPPDLPRYAGGPVEISGATESGDYIGILGLTVPASATRPSSSAEGFAVLGDDGPSRVIGVNVAIPRGETAVVDIEFDLPIEVREVQVTPSARIPEIAWAAGALHWSGGGTRTIVLDDLG